MRRWLVPWAAGASVIVPLLLSGCPEAPFFDGCDCLWDPPPGTLPPPPGDPPPPDEPPGTPPGEPTDPTGAAETRPTVRDDRIPDAVTRPRVDPSQQHGKSKTPGY
jgi:hypothetical protein